jgi:hypothetical protein
VATAGHRLVLVLTLVVAFVALQTGWACTYGGGCEDEAPQTCADGDDHDDEGEAPCAPTCTDCVGCSGPARALLAAQAWTPMASCLTVELDTRVAELAPEAESDRIDRPPRA